MFKIIVYFSSVFVHVFHFHDQYSRIVQVYPIVYRSPTDQCPCLWRILFSTLKGRLRKLTADSALSLFFTKKRACLSFYLPHPLLLLSKRPSILIPATLTVIGLVLIPPACSAPPPKWVNISAAEQFSVSH